MQRLSIKQFCKERGVMPWSFYNWRKRLRKPGAVLLPSVIGNAFVPDSTALRCL